MKKNRNFIVTALAVVLLMTLGLARAEDQKFTIKHFNVQGNTLLPKEEVDRLVAPYQGTDKVYGDVQKALEALEGAYHQRGYNTVQVFVPEQELTSGEVILQVTESVIGKVTVAGNSHFSAENIRRSVPELKEGTPPNATRMSENIQLANDNPAKQIEVTLASSDDEGKVDSKINVTERNPQYVYLTADNTGTGATGHFRTGISYQNANLFGGDEVLTAAYTTSPDAPGGVDVNIYSLAYRMPFYSLGDNLDIIYGDSNVNTPSAQATGFGLSGKGQVYSIHWNHFLPRDGEYSAKVVAGFDWKKFNTTCQTTPPTSDSPPTPTAPASCIPYTTRPVSATYIGTWQGADYSADFNVGLSYNLPNGYKYTVNTAANASSLPSLNGVTDYYSFIANRNADDNFTILRAGGSYAFTFRDWQLRAAATGQWVNDAVVPGEQLGLAGMNAVRGFNERAVATDSGVVVNLEAYTPDVATRLKVPGNLRGLLFYDQANGYNNNGRVPFVQYTSASLSSWGVGLRYGYGKDISFRVDLAQVLDSGPLKHTPPIVGDRSWRGDFSVVVGF